MEGMGGMTKAVDAGLPKLRIEESAARRQSRIDRTEEVVVGVNRFQPDVKDEVDILDIDNTAVREAQVARLSRSARPATRMPARRRWKPCRRAPMTPAPICWSSP